MFIHTAFFKKRDLSQWAGLGGSHQRRVLPEGDGGLTVWGWGGEPVLSPSDAEPWKSSAMEEKGPFVLQGPNVKQNPSPSLWISKAVHLGS